MDLRRAEVVALDCQATGATPAHGEVLEIGWWAGTTSETTVPTRAYWTRLSPSSVVSGPVRKLTGWSERCAAEAVDPLEAWRTLRGEAPERAVIHWARFELPFLADLHARAGGSSSRGEPLPFDVVCVHAIGARLFPRLPRRNLRALAGHLGYSPALVRRARGHVDATAFLWRALVPRLETIGVTTWDELKAWLAAKPADDTASGSRSRRRSSGFPLAAEKRRALPDAPGVYRFVRPNGDVLYVGKAASLRRRVASHFTAGQRTTERALEMLSQAHDVAFEITASALEAALLEADEIKRLDPPYNVQLRANDRAAWFASRDWTRYASAPDADHVVGPLPSRRSLDGLAAMRALLEDEAGLGDDRLRAAAVGVPEAFAPDEELFAEVWRVVAGEHFGGAAPVRTRLLAAARRLSASGAGDDDEADEADDGAAWDAPRVLKSLVRTLVAEGTLVRRARLLGLLAEARVVFVEPGAACARELVIARGDVVERREAPPQRDARVRPPSRAARLACFDAARYDRLRVLSTELARVAGAGGSALVRVGEHLLMLRPAAR